MAEVFETIHKHPLIAVGFGMLFLITLVIICVAINQIKNG